MNTREKGDVAVGRAIADYSAKGYEVLLPLSDKQKFDLVTFSGSFKKVQCKFCSQKTKYNSFEVSIVVCGGNRSGNYKKRYVDGDFDLLFVLTSDDEIYEIPWEKIRHLKRTIKIGKRYKEFRLCVKANPSSN